MHIQSNLLIFNLMGLTERLTYLKILDIQVKIYFIIYPLHNVFGLEMIKKLNFSYAFMCTQKDDIFV